MTFQELLQACANQDKLSVRVACDNPPRHSEVTTGTVKKIDTKGIAVRMDDMTWDSWFRYDIESSDKRSRYVRELRLID